VDVVDPAVAEGLIGLLDGERDQILLDVVVMARGEFGVRDDERDGDVAGLGCIHRIGCDRGPCCEVERASGAKLYGGMLRAA